VGTTSSQDDDQTDETTGTSETVSDTRASSAEFDAQADAQFMGRARVVARAARRRSAPNPWVGCVVVATDTDVDGSGGTAHVVGEGATQEPGGNHAEVEALSAAGERARGATVYVTLEPCSHRGRTPPCVEAMIYAGVARVVVALVDPDDQVAGQGIARLRAVGITVDVGVLADEVRDDLAPYLVQRTQHRAFTVVKTAMSLDGRSAARDGSSQWITGPAARADAHELRADSQAIMVGAGTALADRPSLTVRDADPHPAQPPLRVVLDGRGRVPAEGPLFDMTAAPTLVVTTPVASEATHQAWLAAGAKVLTVPQARTDLGVDLLATLESLAGLGVLQVLVEGGAALSGSLIAAGLADRVVTYVAPTLLGTEGRPAFALEGPGSIDAAARWELAAVRRLGPDVRLDHLPTRAVTDGVPAGGTA
jgi:diaminohydroxyphosphoribosylaminopyrimidine deaminase/5-amino-6-(5-phosphoribosylamino)uracil reductase